RLAPAGAGGQPPPGGSDVSRSRALSNSLSTRSRISIAAGGGGSGADRIASSAIRAPATSAESSWLVAVTVNTFSRERSMRTPLLWPEREAHARQRCFAPPSTGQTWVRRPCAPRPARARVGPIAGDRRDIGGGNDGR